MRYKIQKNWISSLGLIKRKPVLMLPFVIIAFFEALALELIYFSSRPPLSALTGPIIKKFFGEDFLHYPANLFLLPKLFYYAQVAIYIFISAAMIAISVTIFKNIKMNIPLKAGAILKATLKRYGAFVLFGVISILLIYALKKVDMFVLNKGARFAFRYIPNIVDKLYFIISTLYMFLSNVIFQVFVVLTIPIMIIQKKPFFAAFAGGIRLGFKNFITICALIFLPFLLYLPVVLLKSGAPQLVNKTFPGINIFIILAGVVFAVLVDCFIAICTSQFLLDKEGPAK